MSSDVHLTAAELAAVRLAAVFVLESVGLLDTMLADAGLTAEDQAALARVAGKIPRNPAPYQGRHARITIDGPRS